MEIYYEYGMKVRGFSIGTQPKKGFLNVEKDLSGKYYDILVYDRPLTEEELEHYSLVDLGSREIED